MSITPDYADNAVDPTERRVHLRQPVSALAYLDIGPDNGGIVLNLSEEGMGFQAVAPLEGQADVNLRIQLPHSLERIETGAKVVWLSPSCRQAGVRFLDMSLEGRAQIRKWISSQVSPGASAAGSASPAEAGADPLRKPKPLADPRNDKWLSLMADFEPPATGSPTQEPVSKEREEPPDAVVSETPTRDTLSEIVLNPFSQRARLNSNARAKELGGAEAPEQPKTDRLEAEPPCQPTAALSIEAEAAAPPRRRAESQSVLDWPTRAPRIVRSILEETLREGPATPPDAVKPIGTMADSRATSEAIVADARSAVCANLAAATRRALARKLAGIAALFLVFSFLCFDIGTRVGALRSQIRPAEAVPETASTTDNPVLDVVATATPPADASKPAHALTGKALRAQRNSLPGNRTLELALSVSLPLARDPRQEFQPAVPKQTLVPSAPTKPAGNAPTAASLPGQLAATDPGPRSVGGRTLRPTDRFNPCHLTYRVEPAYPPDAQQQHIEGAVKIHQVIGTDGSVESVRLLSGPALLAPAALDAAKYWRYVPALLNGEPVETEQDVEINFRLPD
jgi:TonB family protein